MLTDVRDCIPRQNKHEVRRDTHYITHRSYITPSFDCDVVWGNCTKSECDILERLQNYAARVILHLLLRNWGQGRTQPVNSYPAAQTAPGAARLQGCPRHPPPYLQQLLLPANTRHATGGRLYVPLPKTNFGKSAFSFRSSSLWNTLPAEAHSAPSLRSFISIVKPFLWSLRVLLVFCISITVSVPHHCPH